MPRLTFPEQRNLVLTIHFTFKISLTLSHESNKCRLLSKHIHVHHILLTFWLGLYLVDRNIFWGEISHGKMKGHTCLFQKDLFLCNSCYKIQKTLTFNQGYICKYKAWSWEKNSYIIHIDVTYNWKKRCTSGKVWCLRLRKF